MKTLYFAVTVEDHVEVDPRTDRLLNARLEFQTSRNGWSNQVYAAGAQVAWLDTNQLAGLIARQVSDHVAGRTPAEL